MNEIANCGESSAEQERRLRKRLWCARTIEDPEQKTLDPAGVVRDVSEARAASCTHEHGGTAECKVSRCDPTDPCHLVS